MANKRKENEILREQRQKYAELLEIKKAKQGEITIENEHPLADAMPKTFWGKVKNYAYHYKIAIIVAVILIAVVAFAVRDYRTRVKPDIGIVIYSYHRILEEQIESIEGILTPYCSDLNGDGEVKLTSSNCSFDKTDTIDEMEYSASTHFQTLISGDPQSILFIFDEGAYNHLLEVNDGKTFIEGIPLKLNSELYKRIEKESGFKLPDGLMLCYRKADAYFMKKEEISQKGYEMAKKLFKKMNEEYPADELAEQKIN